MFRRDFLEKGATATVAATATPAVLGGFTLGTGDTLTRLALAETLESYGTDGNPSFVVSYDGEDNRDDLRKWVESEDGGQVLREFDQLDQMAVSVPWSSAGRSAFGPVEHFSGGFDDLGYVDFADGNATLPMADPIEDLPSASDIGGLDLGWRESFQLRLSRSASTSLDTDGLAFDGDAPEATLLEARQHVRAGGDVLDGIDTSGVTVCVIDTGAAARVSRYEDDEGESRIHPDSTDFTTGGDPTVAEDGESAIADAGGHGDWVSACILGDSSDERYVGFAPDAELVVSKSLSDDGGKVADIVAGVDLAIATGADVICMSLGSPQWSESVADALAEAWDAGALPVVAVGNDRYATTFVASPASSEHGLGVTATNVPESGERDDTQLAYFANVGPNPGTQDLSDGASADATPALAAPGINVEIDPVGTLSGTSMAAPMVAGAAAVLASEGHDNDTILERLTESAYPLPNAGETETEYGLLDVEAALEGRERDETQADVRTDAAEARDGLNRALSESRGRRLF